MNYAAEARKAAVWMEARPIQGWSSWEWRRDDEGNVIRFSAYGDRASEHGWEIDHVVPRACDGPSAPWNERPLHWRANVQRGGSRLAEVLALGPMVPPVVKPGIERLAEILATAEIAARCAGTAAGWPSALTVTTSRAGQSPMW